MPHSGGGGSHSGGSHSGGGSPGSSGPSHYRGQSTYYPGSHRYRYQHNGRYHYYYSDRPLRKGDLTMGAIVPMIFGASVLMFSLFFNMAIERTKGGPLEVEDDAYVVIFDESNLMSDEDEAVLLRELIDFRDETGVTVNVKTVPHDRSYGDVEYESYHEYVDMFRDEKHWLIYFVGEDPDLNDEWEWNLMCGDECVRVLNTKQEEKFTRVFQDKLELKTPLQYTIIEALNGLEPDLRGGHVWGNMTVNGESVRGQHVSLFALIALRGALLVGFLLILCGIWMKVKPLTGEKKSKTEAVLDDIDMTVSCGRCGFKVQPGTAICPQCGAVLSVRKM